MIQEYLLQEAAERDTINAYKSKGIKKRLFSADNGKCWYVQFSAGGENEEVAKQLSEVDEYIRGAFHVIVLENGCSAYFNKRLFPLVSGFEYKLRKLLYLTSAINRDDKSAANIADLEAKDFGEIFSLLFIDNIFMGKVKENIKNLNRDVFTKADVIAAIESIDENALWDKLLCKDAVPTLRRRFNDVREYRNGVMHSRHISWKRFKEIQDLYKAINNELDKTIYNIEVVESKAPSKPTFNQTLECALRAQEQLLALADAIKPSLEGIQHLSELYIQNPALTEALERVKEITSVYTASPELQRTLNQFAQMKKAYQMSPAMFELLEQINNIAKLKVNITPAIKKLHEIARSLKVPKIEIPPEILRLQSTLASFHIQDEVTEADKTEEKKGSSEKSNDEGGKTNG